MREVCAPCLQVLLPLYQQHDTWTASNAYAVRVPNSKFFVQASAPQCTLLFALAMHGVLTNKCRQHAVSAQGMCMLLKSKLPK